MSTELVSLDDAVLPLIRTNDRDLYRYANANRQGARMSQGTHLLRLAVEHPEALEDQGIRKPSAHELYVTVDKALASALRVIARADDSAGIIGDACREILALHPVAAARDPQLDPLKLADRVYEFDVHPTPVDFFEFDPVAYAPALGERGVARLRGRVEAFCAGVPSADPADGFADSHHRFMVEWFAQRFAVLDRDVEAIIRTHALDGRVAVRFTHTSEAFEEIGRFDLAIEWAQKAATFDRGLQAAQAEGRWMRLLREHDPAGLEEAARILFDRRPTAGTGGRLVAVVGDAAVPEVEAALSAQPEELSRFQLDAMGDPARAWRTAQDADLRSAFLWRDLANAYLPIDPVAALPCLVELVEWDLEDANTRKYRPAAKELVRIRTAALASGDSRAVAIVDDGVAWIRDAYRRRPSLVAALDRARLP